MLTLAFAISIALSPSAAAAKASTGTLKLVELFLKTATADLPPEAVPEFLAVNSATLPKKLRQPFEAKRLELWALKRISDSKQKAYSGFKDRGSGAGCEPPKELDSIGPMLAAGFTEITQEEEEWLMRETECSECELRQESSLTLVSTPPKRKGARRLLHYLMQGNDVFMALIAGYRSGQQHAGGTPFFGIGGSPKCRR